MLISEKSQHYIDLEERYGAHNYHPLPVVLAREEVSISGMLTVRGISTSSPPIQQ